MSSKARYTLLFALLRSYPFAQHTGSFDNLGRDRRLKRGCEVLNREGLDRDGSGTCAGIMY